MDSLFGLPLLQELVKRTERRKHGESVVDELVKRGKPGSTKNKEGRAVVMTPKVRELVMACSGKKEAEAPLFTRKNGKSVREFRWTWYTAAVACGLGKLTCPLCKRTADKPSHRCPHCKQKVAMKYAGRILHDVRRAQRVS